MAALKHCFSKALLRCLNLCARLCFCVSCQRKCTGSCHSVLCLEQGLAPTTTGLQSFLGIPGLALFWDRVFLIKVRRWSHDQNRMESYFEVCHGHPVWGHLYMQNMGEGRGPRRAGSSIWLHTHFWSKYSLSYMWWQVMLPTLTILF